MFGRNMESRKVAMAGVGLVLGIYAWEWYAYTFLCKPAWGWAILFHALFIMAVWSYLQTVATDPGTSRCEEWRAWSEARTALGESAKGAEEDDPESRAWQPGRATWCAECAAERPERAHHCRDLGVCVLRMDHYCPWVGNCVAWRNHKYFLLMNFWSFWACSVLLATMREPSASEAITLWMADGELYRGPAIAAITSALFWAVTGGMFLNSLFMACRNITTIEEFYYGSNPYELPSSQENVKQLFGAFDWRFLLPVAPLESLSGCQFPLRKDRPTQRNLGESYGSVHGLHSSV